MPEGLAVIATGGVKRCPICGEDLPATLQRQAGHRRSLAHRRAVRALMAWHEPENRAHKRPVKKTG